MTREEAIKELKELEYYNRPFDNSAEAAEVATRKAQAVDMAIKALEQTELNSSYNSINSIKTELNELDCISRQSVLEKAYKIAGYDRNAYVVDVADIEALPSVSTEKTGQMNRLYSYLNDMRYGIAPDETTPQDERSERLAQVDIIDSIMEWIEKLPQPYKGESEE